MKVVVSAEGNTLDSPASPVFGRCPTYVFVDTDTLAFEAVPNPAMAQGGGAGIQAAQFVLNRGAAAVLTGSLGPNAFDVLQAAGVPGYLVAGGTVRQVVEQFKAGGLQPLGGANVAAHAGMGGGPRRAAPAPAPAPTPAPAPAPSAHDAEMGALHDILKDLRQQLAQTVARIDELEKES